MEPNHLNTQKGNYTHLKESERYKIEVFLEQKMPVQQIARILGRARSTVYREIQRGTRTRLHWDLSEKRQYRADIAQRDCREKARHKGPELKIGKDHRLEEHIRTKILKELYSPDALIGEIKAQGLKFEGMICTKTLYNYIDAGIFSGISNENLWQKRKRKKKAYRQIVRASRTNRGAKSIERRPQEANERLEYGHWEGDCVKGPKGRSTSLFTLTERKTLEQIILKIERTSQEEIQRAMDFLEEEFKDDFSLKFKSITFDNGVEFLDWTSLERSATSPDTKRTLIYFAHAYAAWERGSNEVQNKMIRRFIPKGTDIHDISDEEILRIQNWMNNYPRKKLGYKSANQYMNECSHINRAEI